MTTAFDFKVDTVEGVTFTPWTDGWAIGFKVEAKGMPTRYLYLNPSSDTGLDDQYETNAFIYLGPSGRQDDDGPCCHINIWDRPSDSKCDHCEQPIMLARHESGTLTRWITNVSDPNIVDRDPICPSASDHEHKPVIS